MIEIGCVGFGPIGGLAGAAVGLGQGILGDFSSDDWALRHVFVVIGRDECVEAMPGGVRRSSFADRMGVKYRYLRPPYADEEQAEAVAFHAERMLNVPYNWLNYPALTAHHLRLPVPHLDRWISRTTPDGYPKHVICSQLADAALTMADFEVFDDGRLPQDVWPSSLYRRLVALGSVHV